MPLEADTPASGADATGLTVLRDPWVRLAAVIWLIMVVAVCARSAVSGSRQTVYPVWQGAGHDWRTGHDLYGDKPGGDPIRFGYRYSPLVAALFTGFDLMPAPLGNVLVRLLNAAVFLGAAWWWLRDGVPEPVSTGQRGLIMLLLAPLALGSLNNGQMNLLMVGLMLLTVTGVAVGRWNLAAACAAGAVLLKIYPIAFVLLIALIHPRRFLPRFVAALLLLSAVPFLLQSPDYVLRQYVLWWERVRHNDAYRRFWPPQAGYRDVWLLFRQWGVPVTLHAYTLLQLAGAAGCALVVLFSRWRHGPGRPVLFVALAVACSWMLVLGPSPESCTFVLIAAPLAWWLVHSRLTDRHLAHSFSVFGYGLLLFCGITGFNSTGILLYQVAGLQPIGVLCFAATVIGAVVSGWPRDGQRPDDRIVEPDACLRPAA